MRKSNEQKLGDVIKQLIKAYQFDDKISEVRIVKAWEKVMGQQINALTERIVFNKGDLTVFLRSAPLREELSMARTKIIEQINKEMGNLSVKELNLR